MTDIQALKRTIKVCMFDQYGTVVDMQTGLWEVAVDFLKAKGWKGNPYAFVTWWRRTQRTAPSIRRKASAASTNGTPRPML